MGVASTVRKDWVVFSLTFRYLLTTRRGIATALLASTPLIVVLALAAAGSESLDIFLFQLMMVPLFLQVVLIFITLVHATTIIREEIEDNTLPYLLTRPISKPAIALSKYGGYLVVVLLLLLPPFALSYVVTQAYAGDPLSADADTLLAFSLAAGLGALAYGAFFFLLSVILRRPLAAGLLFGFLWESIVGSLPGDVPKLSIIYYLRTILVGIIEPNPFPGFAAVLSPLEAGLVLVGFAVVVLVLAIFLFQAAEFKQKA